MGSFILVILLAEYTLYIKMALQQYVIENMTAYFYSIIPLFYYF